MIDNLTYSWESESVTDSGNLSDILVNYTSEPKETHLECTAGALPSIVTNIVLATLYSLVCVAGIFGNSLVIFVVIKFR